MKLASKKKPKYKEKSARTEQRSQLIQEPAAFRSLAPADRLAIEEYFRFHPLARRRG